MQGTLRAVGAIIMAAILVVSIIYLAFSIDIIHSSKQYGEFFRPKQSLSIFNIIISIYGICLAIFCLFIVSAARTAFCRIAVIGCLVFALFAFASLIAALSINLVAIDRTSGLFINYMNRYTSNADARNIIDTVQVQYECCGNNVWYDWIEMPKRTTTSTAAPSTRSSRTPRSTSMTDFDLSSSTTYDMLETSSTTTESTSTLKDENTDIMMTESTRSERSTRTPRTRSTTTTESTWTGEDENTESTRTRRTPRIRTTTAMSSYLDLDEGLDTDTDSIWNFEQDDLLTDNGGFGRHHSPSHSSGGNNAYEDLENFKRKRAVRRKRSFFSHGDPMAAIDIPFSVVLPGSCCLDRSIKPDSDGDSYCVPKQSSENGFYRDGCSKMISKYAIAQTFTTAVINSLLIVLALLSVSILNRLYPLPSFRSKIYRNPSLQSQQIIDGYAGPSTIGPKARDSVVNPHSDYSVYQKNG